MAVPSDLGLQATGGSLASHPLVENDLRSHVAWKEKTNQNWQLLFCIFRRKLSMVEAGFKNWDLVLYSKETRRQPDSEKEVCKTHPQGIW